MAHDVRLRAASLTAASLTVGTLLLMAANVTTRLRDDDSNFTAAVESIIFVRAEPPPMAPLRVQQLAPPDPVEFETVPASIVSYTVGTGDTPNGSCWREDQNHPWRVAGPAWWRSGNCWNGEHRPIGYQSQDQLLAHLDEIERGIREIERRGQHQPAPQ